MELTIKVSEVRLLEFGYYVLHVSCEHASKTSDSLQVDCSSSSIAKDCGEMSIRFLQHSPKVVVNFLLAEDGNSTVVIAKGSSTMHLENRHRFELFQSGSDVFTQSVILTALSESKELEKYFGTITVKVASKSSVITNAQVPVASLSATVNDNKNFTQILGIQQGQLLSSTLLADAHTTVEVFYHTIEGISHKFLVSLACLSTMSRSQHLTQVGNVSHTTKEQQSILSFVMLSHSVNHNTLEVHFADQHRGMLLVSLSYPLNCFSPFVTVHLHVPLELIGGWGSLIFSVCLRPPLQHHSGYVGIELQMHDLQTKEELSHHTIVMYGVIDIDSFPSTLVPDKPPFTPVNFEKVSATNNGGQLAVIPSQPCSTFPVYYFFPVLDGTKHDTLHLLFYCVPQEHTKAWWKSAVFSSLSLNIGSLKQGQSYRWHHSSKGNTGSNNGHLKNFDFVVRSKSDSDEFLDARIDLDQLPEVDNAPVNELPSAEAVVNVLPPPPSHISGDVSNTSPNTRPSHRVVAEDDVYIHLVSEVKEYRAAIHQMGEDILGLRSENARLDEEVTRLQQIISSSESTLVVDTTELEACSKLELIHKLSEFYRKYTVLLASNSSMKQEVQSLRNTRIQKNDLEKEHLKLQNAHAAQQKLLQKLQGKVEKYQRYSQTIQDREVIISKLEALLEQQVHKQQGVGDAKVFLSEENTRLREQLRQLEEDLNEEVNKRKHDAQLVEQIEKLKNTGTILTSDIGMEDNLKRSEARVKALQEQLQLNAKEWGMQKTQFEIELTRLRTHIAALNAQSASKSPMRQASNDSYPGFPMGITKPVSL